MDMRDDTAHMLEEEEISSEAIQAACVSEYQSMSFVAHTYHHQLAGAPRNALLRHRFFRRVYLIYYVLTTLLILVPIWAVFYLNQSNRPRRNWTLERCLRVRVSRRFCQVVARCEIDYLGRNLDLDLVRFNRFPIITLIFFRTHSS